MEQVQLHVHEARQEGDVAEVELGRVVRCEDRIHGGDPLVLHGDGGGRAHLARLDIDPAGSTDDELIGHAVIDPGACSAHGRRRQR
jgi:hypothetical protein